MRRATIHLAALVALAACGDSGKSDNDASLSDATLDVTGEASADVIVTDAAVDAPLTGCAARTTSDAPSIFVSTAVGNDTSGCGTRAIPCKSVQQGITEAAQQSGKTIVYVASGKYVESITLAAGLTIEGGWNASGLTWSPICDGTTSSAVSIEGVQSATVTASFNGAAVLRDLTITSKASPSAGESLYGIFATGSSTSLTLDATFVTMSAGGAGANGSSGPTGDAGSNGGCSSGGGAGGGTGAAGGGGAADASVFAPSGYVGANGGDGGAGQNGQNGSVGGQGACATCQTFAGSCPSSCTFGTKQVCATNGGSGCGGAGGGGGTFGEGGGASIAVYVWDAHVTTFGGSFTSGNGGNGGVGGGGADGGSGASGVSGTSASCATQLASPQCLINFCSGTLVSSTTLGGGAPGGNGGAGGPGAQGGGGSGGWSYAIVAGGDGGVTMDGGTLAHGDAGSGGALSGGGGVSGDRWP